MNKLLETLKKRTENINDKNISEMPTSEFKVPMEIRNERYDICKKCENFVSLTTTCTKCGCFMVFKTYLKSASCPIGKWTEETKK